MQSIDVSVAVVSSLALPTIAVVINVSGFSFRCCCRVCDCVVLLPPGIVFTTGYYAYLLLLAVLMIAARTSTVPAKNSQARYFRIIKVSSTLLLYH